METKVKSSKKKIKDYELHIKKKYAKATRIKKNEVIDEIIDEIIKCNEGGMFLDEEELSFKKLEAAIIAKMILREST